MESRVMTDVMCEVTEFSRLMMAWERLQDMPESWLKYSLVECSEVC